MDKAIPTASRRRRPATDLEGFDRVTSGIGRYEGEDADDVDEDEEEVNCKPIMHQCRMLRIEGIVGLTWEPVISTGMRWSMATIQIRMRKNKHHKPMMDQRRMWRTDLGTSDVNGYECKDGDDADTAGEEEASQADDGSMQNVED